MTGHVVAAGAGRELMDRRSDPALHFHGRELIGAVSSDPEARAVHLAAVDGRVVETPIPVTVLTASGLT